MLEYLNRQITNFRYGYTETANKPKWTQKEFLEMKNYITTDCLGMRFLVLVINCSLYMWFTNNDIYNYAASNTANVDILF